MSIKKNIVAAVLAICAAGAASAATCTKKGVDITVDQAFGASCSWGDASTFFSSNPSYLGQSGWTMADSLSFGGDGALTFSTAPALDTVGGSFSVSNPGGYSFLIALETYKTVGVFEVGKKLTSFDWSFSAADLNGASIWYAPTAVPLPAGGALLLTGFGAFAFLRRRRNRA